MRPDRATCPRRGGLLPALVFLLTLSGVSAAVAAPPATQPPTTGPITGPGATTPVAPGMVLFVADDWSSPHAGTYGFPDVRTPALDRLARQGLAFRCAFSPAPMCTPSRGALLTGRLPHRLGPACNQAGAFPDTVATLPDCLAAAGWAVGHIGKGWDPGRIPEGATDPAGPLYASPEAFLGSVPGDTPFWLWVGSHRPHRPYPQGIGGRSGLPAADAPRDGFLPAVPVVQADLADYLAEVQAADRELCALVRALERSGRAGATTVVVTSDNGMPFPRAKANVYDAGTAVPLVWSPAARSWNGTPRGRVANDLVSLVDVPVTMLGLAGLPGIPGSDGLDLRGILAGAPGERRAVLLERERHLPCRAGGAGYPVRAVRTAEFLFIRNLDPGRWPAGDPESPGFEDGFGDVDPSPTKRWFVDHRDDADAATWIRAALLPRPAEELYDLRTDPAQLVDVARRPEYREVLERIRASLDSLRNATGDPRMHGPARPGEDPWDHAPYEGRPVGPGSVE